METDDAAAVVSLHAPANEATRNMIDAAALFSMKPNAYLINVARGRLVRNELLGNELSIILKQPRGLTHGIMFGLAGDRVRRFGCDMGQREASTVHKRGVIEG
jgi:hypothetical protein